MLRILKVQSNKSHKISGFTAIELLFGLGIIAVATAALVLWSRSNVDKNNANIMVIDISIMVQNIQSNFAGSNNGYTDLNNATAISMKLIPRDLVVPSGSSIIKSKFQKGTVLIAAGTNNDDFTITYDNVPVGVCTNVATTIGGSEFSNITINGNAVYDTSSQLELNPATVGTACATNKEVATIVFTSS